MYPGGTIGTDKVGDVAFSQGTTYYCYQEPNAYTVTYSGSTGWVPAGWIKLDTKGPGTPPQVGDKLTDGVYTSTIQSIEAPWGVQYSNVSFMLINISPAISSWKNGSGSLTVYTGSSPNLNCWARIGSEIVAAPATNTSVGIVGQIAYDSSYMYRCTQTSLTEVSQQWLTMTYMASRPGFPNASWTTQQYGSNTLWLPKLVWSSQDGAQDFNSTNLMPQVGWKVSDGVDTRTITTVAQNGSDSPFQSMYQLQLDGTLTNITTDSITIISQQAQSGVWKRIALNADTW